MLTIVIHTATMEAWGKDTHPSLQEGENLERLFRVGSKKPKSWALKNEARKYTQVSVGKKSPRKFSAVMSLSSYTHWTCCIWKPTSAESKSGRGDWRWRQWQKCEAPLGNLDFILWEMEHLWGVKSIGATSTADIWRRGLKEQKPEAGGPVIVATNEQEMITASLEIWW